MDFSWLGTVIVAVVGLVAPIFGNFINNKNALVNEQYKIVFSKAKENYEKELKLFDAFCGSLANLKYDLNNEEFRMKAIGDYYKLYPYLFYTDSEGDKKFPDFHTRLFIESLWQDAIPEETFNKSFFDASFEGLEYDKSILEIRFKEQIQIKSRKTKSRKRNNDTKKVQDYFPQLPRRKNKQ